MTRIPRRRVSSLVEAIQAFADCPCARHEEAFLRAFQRVGEVAFHIVEATLRPRDHEITLARDDYREITLAGNDHVVVACMSDGEHRLMYTFPSVEIANRVRRLGVADGEGRPRCPVGKIGIAEVCRMLLQTDLDGIAVWAGTDDEAWAAVTRKGAAEMSA